MFFSFLFYTLIYPFLFMDVYIGLFLVLLSSSLSIPSLILTAFSGCSKHTILGSIRIISQLISFELLTSTLIILISFSFNDLPIVNYWCQLQNRAPFSHYITTLHSHSIYSIIIHFNIPLHFIITLSFHWIIIPSFSFLLNHKPLLIFYFIATLAETNRIPSDLPEPEPESVAGFITEYSSIYYSIIVLTEYTNIIALILFMITIYSLPSEILLLVLYTTSLIRPTLVRLKFDELMINVWIILSPIMFILLVLVAVPITPFIRSQHSIPLWTSELTTSFIPKYSYVNRNLNWE